MYHQVFRQVHSLFHVFRTWDSKVIVEDNKVTPIVIKNRTSVSCNDPPILDFRAEEKNEWKNGINNTTI